MTTVVFTKSRSSSSPTVVTPGATVAGVMQNGGHFREVLA
jgi:hypothetical protein